MTNYVSFIETAGNTSLAKSDVPAAEAVLGDNPGSTYVAAFYNGRYIDLFFTKPDGSLQAVPSSWWANQRSPIAAEVRSGENQITVFFRTNRQINIAQQPWQNYAIQIVRFGADTGVETSRYNFNTKKFEPLSSPRGLEWLDDSYTAEFITGDTSAFDKEYGSYGVTSSSVGKNYREALSTFANVLNPSNQSGNSTGNQSQSNIQETSQQVDNLIGAAGERDIFSFVAPPSFSGSADKITNYKPKDRDTIQISKSVFGIATGRFSVAKKPKSLNKLLSSDVDIIYNKKSGQLILNANGAEPGFGDDGGVFALLAGSPVLNNSSVSFI